MSDVGGIEVYKVIYVDRAASLVSVQFYGSWNRESRCLEKQLVDHIIIAITV